MDKKKSNSNKSNILLFKLQLIMCLILILAAVVYQTMNPMHFDTLRQLYTEKVSDEIKISGKIGNTTPHGENVIHTHGITAPYVTLTAPLHNPIENGTVTSTFGTRDDPIDNQKKNHFGVDISAPHAQDIRAALSGTVIEVGENPTSGKYLYIDHSNDIKTFYAHCDSITVSKGDHIKRGQSIAKVGSTGRSTGDHLHLEFSINDIKYDPLPLLQC